METALTPIFDHGLSEEMLKDLAHLRQLRIDLVENQLNDIEQTKNDLSAREIITLEDLELASLRKALEQKLEDLRHRLNEPTAIFMDEIQFFLEVAED